MSRRAVLRGALAAGAALVTAPAGALALPRGTAGPEALKAFIEDRLRVSHCPAVSVVVVHGGETVWRYATGLADVANGRRVTTDDAFNIASVSKTVMVTALLQAMEGGLINLDTDVNDVLPFRVGNPHHPQARVTARQLLTHTSSLRDNWGVLSPLYVPGDSPIALGHFLHDYLVPGGRFYHRKHNFSPAAPGKHYAYCNVGAALAGYLVEAASGVAFDEWCRERIFEPLGMTSTSWHLAGLQRSKIALPYRYRYATADWRTYGLYGYPDYPDGLLRTTPSSLAKLLAAVTRHGAFPGGRLLEASTIREMLTNQLPPSVGPWQGLIWYRVQPDGIGTLYGHNGGDDGVWAEMFFRPRDGSGAIVMANGDALRAKEASALVQIRNRLIREAMNF
ncbi:MAG TPA: serine hydrolase [Actinomycetota bacterium]|nr:serine hydrolase [Actinomycetota bacterium]